MKEKRGVCRGDAVAGEENAQKEAELVEGVSVVFAARIISFTARAIGIGRTIKIDGNTRHAVEEFRPHDTAENQLHQLVSHLLQLPARCA